jgi:starch synthase
VHTFDAPTAAVAALLRGGAGPALPTLLTVLDAQRVGRFSSGAHQAFPGLHGLVGDSLSLLELGLASSQLVVAGSEDTARDLGSPHVSGNLAPHLVGERAPTIVGTGLDYALFNPATDTAVPARFDAQDPSNKGRCKSSMLNDLGLELELDRPLVLATAAGARESQLLVAALPALLKNDIAVIATVADPTAAAELERLIGEYPSDLARLKDQSEAGRRRALAAADFAICLEEGARTSSALQAAQRYGAVPVALARGAVVDAIVDCDAELETGTGFLFDSLETQSLLGAAARALAAYGSPGHARLRRRVMRLDLSWERVARRYAQLYRKAAS